MRLENDLQKAEQEKKVDQEEGHENNDLLAKEDK